MYRTYATRLCDMRNLLTVGLIVLLSTSSFAQDCGANLSVEKNRNSKSVYANGAFFTLELTNTSSSPKTFTLSTSHIAEGCTRGEKTLLSKEVAALSIMDAQSKKSLSNITLKGKETYKFYVKAMATSKTSSKQWGCYEVRAEQNGCVTSTVVKLLIPDSSER